MNIDKDDPRFTAYVLGELPENDMAEMEELLLTSNEAREIVDDIFSAGTLLQDVFANELSNENYQLTPEQRSELFLFPAKDLPEPTMVTPRWNRSAAVAACSAAAACAALAAVYLFTQGGSDSSPYPTVVTKDSSPFWIEILLDDSFIASNSAKPVRSEIPTVHPRTFDRKKVAAIAQAAVKEVAELHSAPAESLQKIEALVVNDPRWRKADNVVSQLIVGLSENPYLSPSDKAHRSSSFAMKVGSRSYAMIQNTLNAGTLPDRNSVRIEEMVNAFTYDYAGPDKKGEAFGIHVESNDCPWAPGNRLVLVGVQGYEMESDSATAVIAKDANVEVLFNAQAVEAYRLIGYSSGDDTQIMGAGSGQIKAGHQVTALYEVIPKGEYPPVFAMPAVDQSGGLAIAASDKKSENDGKMLEVQVQYKTPEGGEAITISTNHEDRIETPWESASTDYRFAASVASYGMFLRSDTLLSSKDVLMLLPTKLTKERQSFADLVAKGAKAQ